VVAAGLAPIGIGSDTCGSVRIPAAFNGLVCLKTTFGRISLHGTGLLSGMLDTVGPLRRSVDDCDCAELLRTLAAPDACDASTQSQTPFDLPQRLQPARPAQIRIALPDAKQFPSSMHPPVLTAWTDVAKRLEKPGAQIVPVRLPDRYFDLAKQVGTIIASEAYALHRKRILPQPHDQIPATNGEPPRVFRRLRSLSQAASADSLC